MNEKRLFLLDAYALIFRAYYAFIKNPRITSKGLNTSAVFGFTLALEELLRKEKPTHIAVVFDPPGGTFRHQMYEQYKAHRDETPEGIKVAVPFIKEIISAFKIPIIEVPGFEADDVIGTLAKKAETLNYTTLMMTSDKDYGQLVSEHIFMFKPKRLGNEVEIWGVEEVCKNFEINNPLQVIDLLALWGDASDNIPGVKGIGEKTAGKLIREFGSVEKIIENIDKLKEKEREKILASLDDLKMSKVLSTIRLDVPVEFDEDKLIMEAPDEEKLRKIFAELEFKTLADRFLGIGKVIPNTIPPSPAQPDLFNTGVQPDLFSVPAETESVMETPVNLSNISTIEHTYHLTDDHEKRRSLIELLMKQPEFCFDTETTGLDTSTAELVGMSFSFKDHEAYYIPIPADQSEALQIIQEFRPVFENPAIRKIGQNIKFDMLMLGNYGVEVKGVLFDTMIAHYLVQPELRHNMDFLSEVYLGYKPVSIDELIGKKGKDQLSMRFVEVGKIKEYAAEDADVTWQLKPLLEKELQKYQMTSLAGDIEMPLVRVLAAIEKTGVSLNVDALNAYAVELNRKTALLESEIQLMAGIQFNISSPKQMGEVLFNKLKIIDDPKMTRTKQFATGEEELQKMADKHPIINKILEYRGFKKLLSTYVETLPKLISPVTGKIHTSYNQAVTSTGRLSSNNPNLQNIPVRDEEGREIRKAFIPSGSDNIFMAADYSQIELRLMAHLSEDSSMIEAFRQNTDIHAATAAKIFKISLDQVTREMRSKAKVANFGIIYGISAFGLSQRLNITRTEGKQLIDGYFATYPGVKKYMDHCIMKAREAGYVETLLGRRRYLADINSRNAVVRGFAERNAINAPIQGSAADIIKIAMVRIYNRFESLKLRSKMILQVHDELDFDVYKPELDQVKEIVTSEMQNALEMKVPLVVEIGTGNNWLEAH
ncbi:MAG: DNA polymerase I [Bacteroidia bacterium]|nr:DNA polymerase I [Bacteroidia bacterium]